MDSITQIVLGASVGYAVAGKQLGKKAFLWGAFAGTLPDLDIIVTVFSNDPFTYLKHHRGFSHSLVFSVVCPTALYAFLKRFKPNWDALAYSKLFFWGILTHLLLDSFTSWGTQVFWPFSYRVAFNSLFIIDPAYTIPLLLALMCAIFSKSHQFRQKALFVGLLISSLYLLLSLVMKGVMHEKFELLFNQNIAGVSRFTSRPTPMNLMLWSATAETDLGYYYGLISVFDKNHQKEFYFVPKNHELLTPYLRGRTGSLVHYSKGYYRVMPTSTGVVMHDLRYGFMGDPFLNDETYVFSYVLQADESGDVSLVIKNPRPQNTELLLSQMWTRLKGI